MADTNPFWVWTPENIEAQDAVKLFVEPFTDFPAVESPSHTFIHGPRGSGKSMMFRMMRPDCASMLRGDCTLADLPYLGIYIPVKKTEISQTDIVFLEKHPAGHVFSEHMLCLYFAQKICEELSSSRIRYGAQSVEKAVVLRWVAKRVYELFDDGPAEDPLPSIDGVDWLVGILKFICDELSKRWDVVEQLVRRLPLEPESLRGFDQRLLSYHGFLLPFLSDIGSFGVFPDCPTYLLVDDVDNLSRTQTQILNSWIASRTTGSICIKASTQMRYKTRSTFGGQRIEAPHDYHEVDVGVLYTTRKEHYMSRLEEIASRRLTAAGLDVEVREFFPEDPEQVAEIAKISDDLRAKADAGEGRGHRSRDDSNRYSRPEFIRMLGGGRKSTHSYSYSGFDQLAHISSGVVRWFLEPASRMYAEQISAGGGNATTSVSPSVQNSVLRAFSEEFFQDDFERMKREAKEVQADSSGGSNLDRDYLKLENLINAMGRTFFSILVDKDRAERRVFSIALSDSVHSDVQRVLDLGVREGYLYRATIGRKSGHGRTARYVLSRRLAPYFSLDPTSFSGYLFVTNDNLRQAMASANARLREIDPDSDEIQTELSL